MTPVLLATILSMASVFAFATETRNQPLAKSPFEGSWTADLSRSRLDPKLPIKGADVTIQMKSYETNNLLRQTLLRDTNRVTTDADGKFAFEPMFPGHEFSLFVMIPGFRHAERVLERATLKVGERRDVGKLQLRDPKKRDDE